MLSLIAFLLIVVFLLRFFLHKIEMESLEARRLEEHDDLYDDEDPEVPLERKPILGRSKDVWGNGRLPSTPNVIKKDGLSSMRPPLYKQEGNPVPLDDQPADVIAETAERVFGQPRP